MYFYIYGQDSSFDIYIIYYITIISLLYILKFPILTQNITFDIQFKTWFIVFFVVYFAGSV